MPASGKNLGKDYAVQHGIPHFATGDIVRSECAARGLEPTAENTSMISMEFKHRGEDVLTRMLVERLECGDHERSDDHGRPGGSRGPEGDCAIVEGMRSMAEIEMLRGRFDIAVCAFVVDSGIRRKRYLGRGRREDDPAFFDERDMREIGYGVGDVIATADFYVLNNGTMEESMVRFSEIASGFFGNRD